MDDTRDRGNRDMGVLGGQGANGGFGAGDPGSKVGDGGNHFIVVTVRTGVADLFTLEGGVWHPDCLIITLTLFQLQCPLAGSNAEGVLGDRKTIEHSRSTFSKCYPVNL